VSKPRRSPLVGYNHNISHLGRVFHVQTEDSGPATPRLFTHLFFGGTILASLKHEYEAATAEDKVKGLMQGLHKSMIRDLLQAKFDEKLVVFFRARGEEILPEPGALPSVPMAETPAPLVAAAAPASLPHAAGLVSAPPLIPPAPPAPPAPDSPSGVPLPIGGTRRNTRPIASMSAARRPAADPPTTRLPDSHRVLTARTATPSVVRAASPASGDAVLVERNVIIGGSIPPPARPARLRPAIPYVVAGESAPQTSLDSEVTDRMSTEPGAEEAVATDNASGRVSSTAVTAVSPPVKEEARKERNLDEAILEYLGDDGEQ
jgi:hypothetical protein